MWSDTLLAAERAHILRLLVWSAGSVLTGTLVIAALTIARRKAPIVSQFVVQMTGWGALELALAAFAFRRLAMRDVAAATRLDRVVWFNAGLDFGVAAAGAALIVIGWVLGRRPGLIGAGAGVTVQGLALALINLSFTSTLSRLV